MITKQPNGEREVTCDLCQNETITHETNAKDARWQAKGWGWTRHAPEKRGLPAMLDLCDVCTEAAAEKRDHEPAPSPIRESDAAFIAALQAG